MNRKYLIITIILVLVVLFELSILGKIYIKNDSGFFINLATTFLGGIITLIIVDLIISNHENRIKSKVERRIIYHVQEFINSFLLSIHITLKYNGNLYSWDEWDDKKYKSVDEFINKQQLKNVRKQIFPDLKSKIEEIEPDTYKELISSVKNYSQQLDDIYKKFHQFISYEELPFLLDVDNTMSSILKSNLYLLENRYSSVEQFFADRKRGEVIGFLSGIYYDLKIILLKIIKLSELLEKKYGTIPFIIVGDDFYDKK